MILLAIDIGNSNVKLGLFDGDRLARTWRVTTRPETTDDEAAVLVADLLAVDRGGGPATRLEAIDAVALVSVVPSLTESFSRFARRRVGVAPLIADAASLAPILDVDVPRPHEVGGDRLVNAVAARSSFGTPTIVVDAGSATTFDAIGADGIFLGGAIAPGPRAMLDVLHTSTARLPRVELRRPAAVIGRDTTTAMQSGAVNGYAALVHGMVGAMRRELLDRSPQGARVTVVATGGHSGEPWVREIDGIDAFQPELTLRGLRLAFSRLREPLTETVR